MAFTVKDAVQIAVETEQLGEAFYNHLAKKFSDNEKLREMFRMLAADEVDHEAQFKELLDSVEKNNREISGTEKEYLDAVDLRKFFKRLKNVPEDATPLDVLKTAYSLEKEAVLFFSGLKDIVGDSPELERIVEIEKGHMTKVMKYIVTEAKFRGIEDVWI